MSRYGADRAIPNTYQTVPEGFVEDSASMVELRAAGFHGQMSAADVEAHDSGLPPDVRFKVLRDPSGSVVAEWDEGRWWTPGESDEFLRQIVTEGGPSTGWVQRFTAAAWKRHRRGHAGGKMRPAPGQSCVVCDRGDTDTAIAFHGEAEFAIAALHAKLGLSLDEAMATVRVFSEHELGCEPGMVRRGEFTYLFPVCQECADKAGLPVGQVGSGHVPGIRQSGD